MTVFEEIATEMGWSPPRANYAKYAVHGKEYADRLIHIQAWMYPNPMQPAYCFAPSLRKKYFLAAHAKAQKQ